jgi:hypothetical protein
MNIKAITAIALATLVASTSLASAAGGGIIIKQPMPKDPVPHVDPDHYKPIYIPIEVTPPIYGPEKPKEPVEPTWEIIPSDPIVNPNYPKPILNPGPLDPGGKSGDGQADFLALACAVADPLGSSNSFWIVNAGNVALPVGLKIRYRVAASGDRGAFLLPRQIAVGDKLLIPNLLHGAPDGAPCKAEIIT